LSMLLRVNMSKLSVQRTELEEKHKWLAGRALTSKIIAEEVPPHSNSLGTNNKLVIACGLLAGTSVSSTGRISIGAKSPLTGGIKEANGGGNAANKMAKLGLRGIILEGISHQDDWYLLYINANEYRLEKAIYLKGKGTFEKTKILKEKYGSTIGLILIGPAGEKLLVSSGITNTDPEGMPTRYCARGGLGAVMGSKKILAIVLDDKNVPTLTPKNKEKFREKVKEYNSLIRKTPQTAEVFPKYGTSAVVDLVNALGALPTRNFSNGVFEGAPKINGEALYQTIIKRGGKGKLNHSCMTGCIIQCSNVFPDSKGNTMVSPLEYETIGMVGSNCGIDNLDTIANINHICNDYGIDTIETGGALALCMEAGIVEFGDGAGALKLMKEITDDTFLGKILASGVATTGQVLGLKRIPVVKGQCIPAYDPRTLKGLGVTYITSPMGADHTAGHTLRANVKHHLKDKQVEISCASQLGATLFDYLGLCSMLGSAITDKSIIASLISLFYDTEITEEGLLSIASETLKCELQFNRLAGFTDADDYLPEFFYEEPITELQSVFDLSHDEIIRVYE